MWRTAYRGLAVLTLCLALQACSGPHEPEPKAAPGATPNPRLKLEKDIGNASGPLK
jgi:hypothetical protein